MHKMSKKRIQITMNKGTIDSVDYIIKKAGLTPSAVVSMIYAEIDHTGKIPFDATVSQRDIDKVIKASANAPSVKLDTAEKISDFFDDDGGY